MVKEKAINILERVEKIFNEEIEKTGLRCELSNAKVYNDRNSWPRDDKIYSYVAEIELRKDGRFFWNDKFLSILSNRIINEVQEINKVVYVLDKK